MISSSLSRVGEGNKEWSQLTVLLKGLDEKCEFGQKGITLEGVKANQKCHSSVHAVKFPPENQFGYHKPRTGVPAYSQADMALLG